MNLYEVKALDFDYSDKFCYAIVWAKDELHAERLVRVKNEELPKKKRLVVQKIELENDEEQIIDTHWFYG